MSNDREELIKSMQRLNRALKRVNGEEEPVMMKFLAALIVITLMFVVGYFTMVYGWGLEVKSWPWIIGGYVAAALAPGLVKAVLE